MSPPPRQLTLDLPHAPSFARDDFLTAPSNRDALAAVERWPDWPGQMLLLVGPEGSGKSHLAAIWAGRTGATIVKMDALTESSFASFAQSPALAIEDIDRFGDQEERLFHLLNMALNSKIWMLLTARSPADAWGFRTPDLVSRLRLAPIARLEAPDTELVEAVLFKLFSDRQLNVDSKVVAFIASRIERSLGVARSLVAALDSEALAQGRRVTRGIAAELLQTCSDPDPLP